METAVCACNEHHCPFTRTDYDAGGRRCTSDRLLRVAQSSGAISVYGPFAWATGQTHPLHVGQESTCEDEESCSRVGRVGAEGQRRCGGLPCMHVSAVGRGRPEAMACVPRGRDDPGQGNASKPQSG
jgi:hypothetical protein